MHRFWRRLRLPLGRLWLRSLRIRLTGESVLDSPCVLVLWHEHLPVCMRGFAHRQVKVLISRSADGDLAADLCGRYGYRVHRGSSTRGSVGGMKALARSLVREGGLAGMALDGPRGPRRQPKPGSLWLAVLTGRPVVPISVASPRHFRLSTWDRCLVPWPFSRVEIRLGKPLHPRNLEEIREAMDTLEAENYRA